MQLDLQKKNNYTTLQEIEGKGEQLGRIYVHGRFQPPLHVNHEVYVKDAFCIAEHVIMLITNPNNTEGEVGEATHRSDLANNPFTYDERVSIFESYFQNEGIEKEKYDFKPFDIVDEDGWSGVLDTNIPHLVNTYGNWSRKKLEKFLTNGYQVVHSEKDKIRDVSGTQIREIIETHADNWETLATALVAPGYVPHALSGLQAVLKERGDKMR